jgi:hypothetical protein
MSFACQLDSGVGAPHAPTHQAEVLFMDYTTENMLHTTGLPFSPS